MSEPDTVVVPFDELPRLPESGLRHSWTLYGAGGVGSPANAVAIM